jgi:hypothetical protein|nr:hypothetical protein [uncultured Shinella sp.]
MQNDVVARALAEVAASRAWREKVAAERAERITKLQAVPRPLYVLKGAKQLELRLQ